MHELSIAVAVVQKVTRFMRDYPGSRAVRLVLQVGAISGVDPDALSAAMPAASAGTALEKVEIAVETIDVSVKCRSCEACSIIKVPSFACPSCGSTDLEIAQGHELLIKQVELETGD